MYEIKQSEATIHLYEKQLTDDQLREAISELENKVILQEF